MDGVGVGDSEVDGVGVGDREVDGVGVGDLMTTPLSQINFFPLFTHVYFLPL